MWYTLIGDDVRRNVKWSRYHSIDKQYHKHQSLIVPLDIVSYQGILQYHCGHRIGESSRIGSAARSENIFVELVESSSPLKYSIGCDLNQFCTFDTLSWWWMKFIIISPTNFAIHIILSMIRRSFASICNSTYSDCALIMYARIRVMRLFVVNKPDCVHLNGSKWQPIS